MNGGTYCSLMSGITPSYEDTCSFTCDTGYELTGSETRICQSDGNWNGTDTTCRRGMALKCHFLYFTIILIVSCPSLTNPNNGMINCSLGDDGVPSYEDTCSFTCNTGYELTGSTERTCQSDGSWSGSPVSCIIMECPSSSLPMNSMLAESCSSTYQSMCELQCQEGFNGTGDPSYVCDVLINGSSVMWMAVGDTWSCNRGYNSFSVIFIIKCVCMYFTVQCPRLMDLMNGMVSCSLTNDPLFSYEDTCSFTCNTGYELTGSNTRTCQSDGSWSGTDVMCTRGNTATVHT